MGYAKSSLVRCKVGAPINLAGFMRAASGGGGYAVRGPTPNPNYKLEPYDTASKGDVYGKQRSILTYPSRGYAGDPELERYVRRTLESSLN